MKSSALGWWIVVFALSLAIAPGIALATDSASAATPEAWTLDEHKDGIEVFTRPVAGSGIREFKGVARVNADVEAIVSFLRDADRFETWFPDTPESKLLERRGNVSYQYSVMSTPWPMHDRDNVLRSEMTRDETSGVVEITLTAAPDRHPSQAGRIRVRKARGAWRLEPIASGRTRVTFTMHLEPGGGVPEWLINTRIVATPFGALTNLRRMIGG